MENLIDDMVAILVSIRHYEDMAIQEEDAKIFSGIMKQLEDARIRIMYKYVEEKGRNTPYTIRYSYTDEEGTLHDYYLSDPPQEEMSFCFLQKGEYIKL